RFLLDTGPYQRDAMAAAELQEVVASFLGEMVVDPLRYPLATAVNERGHARIDLPLGAMCSGTLRPYAGAFPERWDVILRTDDPLGVRPLVEQLEDNGYKGIRVEALPPASLGFTIRW